MNNQKTTKRSLVAAGLVLLSGSLNIGQLF